MHKSIATVSIALIIGVCAMLWAMPTPPALAGPNSQGGAPTLISYQGFLTDDLGDPLDGPVSLKFELYDAGSGGAALWTETQTNVLVSQGYFAVLLGSVTPLSAADFNGPTRYLQVSVDPGSGFTTLPRQPLVSVPYALQADQAASAPWNSLTGMPAGFADGEDADTLGALNCDEGDYPRWVENRPRQGEAAAEFEFKWGCQDNESWLMNGNAGTDPRWHVLGTTDAVSLTIVVSDTVALRIEPTVNTGLNEGVSPNIIGGPVSNVVAPDVYGVVIGGGDHHSVTSIYSTVGGGRANILSGSASTVSGGLLNTASDTSATVGGGFSNIASGYSATVGGGQGNTASGNAATVSGGYENTAAGNYSFAAGRRAKANHTGSFVWADSIDADFASTANNQFLIEAVGGVGIGTNAPEAQLHVVDAHNGPANLNEHVMIVENNATAVGSGPDVLALQVTNLSDPGGSTNYITFIDQNGGIGAVEGNGSGGVTFKTSGADLAEYMPLQNRGDDIQAGQIVGLIQGRISKQTVGADQLFVTSASAGFVGNMPLDDKTEGMALVALLGQVPVQVQGPVQAGDYIIPSGEDNGLGLAVSSEALTPALIGQVVGLALEGAPQEGQNQVSILVGLPQEHLWTTMVQQQETTNRVLQAQVADLEARLRVLEGQVTTPTAQIVASHWQVVMVSLAVVSLAWLALRRRVLEGRLSGGGNQV